MGNGDERQEPKTRGSAEAAEPGAPTGARRLVAIGLIGLGGISAVSLACLFSVAVGLGEADQLEQFATWASLVAGLACLGRSVIHIGWGGYLTRHPAGPKRHSLVELNVLVVANASISTGWMVVEGLSLTHPTPHPPLLLALLFPTVLTLVAMETVVCAKDLCKRRGTEMVCEGPVGRRFRELFDTSDEDSGLVHKVMKFFRYPNSPKLVSRFLCLLVALMFVPIPVHTSAAVGRRLNRLIFPPTEHLIEAESHPGRREGPSGGEDTGEGAGVETCGPYDGAPAPSPQREQIVALFAAAGPPETGCPGPAVAVPGQSDVWIAPAHCGAELRSLVVTAPGYLPALLYQQAASFAQARGREGTLLGASDRHPVRGGDFYVLDTDLGSYVLIRRRPSAGQEASGGAALACEDLAGVNLPYTVVPPGLVGLWLRAVEERASEGAGWLFPRSGAVGGERKRFEFLAEYPARESLGSAACTSPLECTMQIDGQTLASSGRPDYVSVSEITSLAG